MAKPKSNRNLKSLNEMYPDERILEYCRTCGYQRRNLTPMTEKSHYTKTSYDKLIGIISKTLVIDSDSSICEGCKEKFDKFDNLRYQMMDARVSLDLMIRKATERIHGILELNPNADAISIKNEKDNGDTGLSEIEEKEYSDDRGEVSASNSVLVDMGAMECSVVIVRYFPPNNQTRLKLTPEKIPNANRSSRILRNDQEIEIEINEIITEDTKNDDEFPEPKSGFEDLSIITMSGSQLDCKSSVKAVSKESESDVSSSKKRLGDIQMETEPMECSVIIERCMLSENQTRVKLAPTPKPSGSSTSRKQLERLHRRTAIRDNEIVIKSEDETGSDLTEEVEASSNFLMDDIQSIIADSEVFPGGCEIVEESENREVNSDLANIVDSSDSETDTASETYPDYTGMVSDSIQSSNKKVYMKVKDIDIKLEDVIETEDYSFADGSTLAFEKIDKEQFFEKEIQLIEEGLQKDVDVVESVKQVQKLLPKMDGTKLVKKKEKIYKCPVCALECKSAIALGKHKVKHPSERKFICEICEKTFVTQENLRYHLTTHGIGPKFKCVFCDKECDSKNRIRRHVESAHKAEFKYTCNICPKAYANQGSLKKHITSHSNMVNLTCHICSAKFLCKYKLNRHLNTHTEKNIPCPYCNSKFNEKYHVTVHITRIHPEQCIEEELKFECTVCDRGFARKHHLRQHLEKFHDVVSEEEQEAMSAEVNIVYS